MICLYSIDIVLAFAGEVDKQEKTSSHLAFAFINLMAIEVKYASTCILTKSNHPWHSRRSE